MAKTATWIPFGLVVLGRLCLCLCQLPKPHVPQYMLDLYQGKSGVLHSYDRVRSYTNIYGGYPNGYIKPTSVNNGCCVHVLGFNLTQVPTYERVEMAELRLYTKVMRNNDNYFGVERTVSIYDASNSQSEKMIATRNLLELADSWESFNVTSAILDWLKSTGEERFLEVRVEGDNGGDMDVSVIPYTDTEPLLVVYSKLTNVSGDGEFLSRIKRSMLERRVRRGNDEDEDEEEATNYISGDPNRVKSRKGRPRRWKNGCRRRPMEVDFDEINYDTWILAPRKYDAFQCGGKCMYPLSDHLTPTKHTILQTLMHHVNPKSVARACCVPTKLGPISVLYQNNDGSTTYDYSHEDMVVEKCGCR